MTDMPQPVLTLEYASPKGEYALDPRLRTIARLSLTTAILSGIAVGSCILAFSYLPVTPIIHAILYVVLITAAVRCGVVAVEMGMAPSVRVFDFIALLGLATIGVAPIIAMIVMGVELHGEPGNGWIGTAGLAFTCIATTSFRAVPFYRQLYAWMAPSSRKLAKMLLILGWVKAIYETLWVGCCATALFCLAASFEDVGVIFAYGALFGLLGFIGVWVWMIVAHALLLKRVKWLLK